MTNLCELRLSIIRLRAAIERGKTNPTVLHPETVCLAITHAKIALQPTDIPFPNSRNRVGRNRWLVSCYRRNKSFPPAAIIVPICVAELVMWTRSTSQCAQTSNIAKLTELWL